VSGTTVRRIQVVTFGSYCKNVGKS